MDHYMESVLATIEDMSDREFWDFRDRLKTIEKNRYLDGSFYCRDCSRTCGMYMLHNDIWKAVWNVNPLEVDKNRGLRAILCWECAEKRLQRRFVKGDLKPNLAVNQVYYLLFDRMQEADDYIEGCLV